MGRSIVIRRPNYMTINAMKPTMVEFVLGGLMGIDWGAGEYYVANYISSGVTRYGSFDGETITFPAQTLAFGGKNYNNGALSWLCDECVLVLP